jgi:hypothetical protein
MAWGYVGEEHCRFSAVRGEQGWGQPRPGCPNVRVLRDGDRVSGFLVEDEHGQWVGGKNLGPGGQPVDSTA